MKRLLCALLSAALLAACFAGAACVGTGGGASDRKIVISTVTGTGLPQAFQAVADGYTALHPDVEVSVELKPANGYSNWLSGELGDSNPVPDIVDVSTMAAASRGKTVNYDEYIDEVSPYSGKPWREQFNYEAQIPNPFAEGTDSLSFERTQVVWLYNKKIFEENGVRPPETWDELIAVCDTLLKNGVQPLGISGTFDGFYAGATGHLFQIYNDQVTRDMINVVRAKEGDYCYDPEKDGVWEYDPTDPYNDDAGYVTVNPVRLMKAIADGTYAADSEGTKFVTEQLARLLPYYAGGDKYFGTDYPHSSFYRGDVAMIIEGAYAVPRYYAELEKEEAKAEENPDYVMNIMKFDVGTFNMPSMEGEYVLAPARTIEVPVGFYGIVEKNKEKTDLVIDFMMYFSSKEGFTLYQNALISNGGVPTGSVLIDGVELPEKYADMYADLVSVGNCQKSPCQTIARGAANDVQASVREWYTYTHAFFKGEIDIDEWAAKHRENVMKYFDDSLKAAGISRADLEYPQNRPSGY